MNWSKLLTYLLREPLQANRMYRGIYLTIQSGQVNKCIARMELEGIKGYKSELKIALSDTLAMLYALAYFEGIRFLELHEIAFSRLEAFVKKGEY